MPRGLAVGAVGPLLIRGEAPVLGWAPQTLPTASDDLARRVLDEANGVFQTGLDTAWADTTILVVSEFGRTVHFNGTTGTDHGTGTVAFVAGGAVKGGKVVADWPGLRAANLFEGRDLRPTTDLRAIFKGVLSTQWGLSDAVLASDVFPSSAAIKPAVELFG